MKITYREIKDENIDFLEDLCNGLMKFQGDHATIRPDIMSSMNYQNRLKPEYAAIDRKYLLVAYDEDLKDGTDQRNQKNLKDQMSKRDQKNPQNQQHKPVGFAFAAVSEVTEEMISGGPVWAKEMTGDGFYPTGYGTPKTIGTFKILFLEEGYRGKGIGKELTDKTMSWLETQPEIEDLWVYVANGNEKVGALYETYGFQFNHKVYEGFILAYRKELK